jgi:dihydropyrimidinase
MPDYDLIIRGGTVVTASDQFRADVGIRAGRIAALAEHLDGGPVLDAAGLLVLPGGVDGHCHIEQLQQTRRPSPREAGLPWRAAPRRS